MSAGGSTSLAAIRNIPSFTTFGVMLRYLRRRERLSQRELAIAVGYSESMISRLEHNERPPDVTTIHALFVPALHLEKQPEVVARLIELANIARNVDAGIRLQSLANGKRRSYMPQRLPVRLASFVGRDDDIRKVAMLLTEKRLVTLTGPGGCGKTSLAVETCRRLAESGAATVKSDGSASDMMFDELCLVELFPISDPALVVPEVLATLGMESNHEQPPLETLLRALAKRNALLVLDNCEHLVDEIASFVQVLLQGCPNLRVIVTGRERLSIVAETVYTVAPLRYPDQHSLPDLAGMMTYPAVQLFVERCQALATDFRLTRENASYVAQICSLLDGVPLALELGAAGTTTFSVQEIAQRLYAHLLLPGPGLRAADPRHTSINDTVAWSYNLLSPAEQQVLAQLSIFVGSWTIEAMQYICADQPNSIGILRQLTQKSLVNVEKAGSADGHTRYSLLRAIREYATQRLAGSSDEERAHSRHYEYYCQLGILLGRQVLGPQHHQAIGALDIDHLNIRAALAYGKERIALAESYVQLAAALPYYWRQRGYVGESLVWLREPLARNHSISLVANALAHVAVLYDMSDEPYRYGRSQQGNNEHLRLLAEAEALIQPCLEQNAEHAAALLMLAVAGLQDNGSNVAAGETNARRAWSILEDLGDVRGVALAGILFTRILVAQGNLDAASKMQEEIAAALEHNQMTWCLCEAYWLQCQIAYKKYGKIGAGRILQRIAKIAEAEEFVAFAHDAYLVLELNDPVLATTMGEQLLARERPKGPSAMLCLALHQLGRMYLNAGRYQQAEEVLDEALLLYPRLSLTLRDPLGRQWSLIDRGEVARLQGDAELAIACFDESIRLFNASPVPMGSKCPLLFRGQVYCEQGNLGPALVDFRQCLRLALHDPNWSDDNYVINCLAGIAEVARMRGNMNTAGMLYAKTVVMGSDWSAAGHGSQPHVMAFYERLMATVPQHREETAFEAAWQEGERLSVDEAVQLALY